MELKQLLISVAIEKNTLELSQVFHLAKCDLKSYYT